jgi:hypothetical protein
VSRAADEIERRMEQAALGALELGALDVQGHAQRNAPIKEGTLRGSGTSSIKLTATGAEATISFPLPYAAKQEKEEDYIHPLGGEAHYLENALKARSLAFRAYLEAAVRKVERGR